MTARALPPAYPPLSAILEEGPLIRRTLRSYGVPVREVADCVQRVVFGAWESIEDGRYRPNPNDPEAFQHWLVAISRNVAITLMKSARMRHEVLMNDPSDTEIETPDPLIAALNRAEARFINRLPEDERAIVARLAMGTTIVQLAKEAGVPKSTMVARVAVIRETVAAMIKRANRRGR